MAIDQLRRINPGLHAHNAAGGACVMHVLWRVFVVILLVSTVSILPKAINGNTPQVTEGGNLAPGGPRTIYNPASGRRFCQSNYIISTRLNLAVCLTNKQHVVLIFQQKDLENVFTMSTQEYLRLMDLVIPIRRNIRSLNYFEEHGSGEGLEIVNSSTLGKSQSS